MYLLTWCYNHQAARDRGEYGTDVIDEPATPYEVSPPGSSEDTSDLERQQLDMQKRSVHLVHLTKSPRSPHFLHKS